MPRQVNQQDAVLCAQLDFTQCFAAVCVLAAIRLLHGCSLVGSMAVLVGYACMSVAGAIHFGSWHAWVSAITVTSGALLTRRAPFPSRHPCHARDAIHACGPNQGTRRGLCGHPQAARASRSRRHGSTSGQSPLISLTVAVTVPRSVAVISARVQRSAR